MVDEEEQVVEEGEVVSGAENNLEDLQRSWEVVQIQTKWKLEPCIMDANHKSFLGEGSSPVNTTTDIFMHSRQQTSQLSCLIIICGRAEPEILT